MITMQEVMQAAEALKWDSSSAEGISSWLKEPEALRNMRMEALERLSHTPWPRATDEPWRRTDPRMIGKSRFDLWNPTHEVSHVPTNRASQAAADAELADGRSVLKFLNSTVDSYQLSNGHAEAGITFASMGNVFDNEHDARLLDTLLKTPDDKDSPALSLYNLVYNSGGYFINIPKNTVTDEPMWINQVAVTPGSALLPHNVIHVAENAAAVIMIEVDATGDQPSWYSGLTRVVLEKNAQLEMVVISHSNEACRFYNHLHVSQQRDSRLNIAWADMTDGWAVLRRETEMNGAGAEAVMHGVHVGKCEGRFDLRSLQRHSAPSTTSDLLYKAVLFDESKSTYRGLISVEPEALNANAYQLNRNLLMDAAARSDSNPCLEILVDEVRCTHGSSAGKLDKEALFYMMSRGIPENDAMRILIEGFVGETAASINNAHLKEYFLSQMVDRTRSILMERILD